MRSLEIQDAVPKVTEDELKDTSKRRLTVDKGDDLAKIG